MYQDCTNHIFRAVKPPNLSNLLATLISTDRLWIPKLIKFDVQTTESFEQQTAVINKIIGEVKKIRTKQKNIEETHKFRKTRRR